MANTNKFEAMLEKLIAEDRAGAEDLFHEIVVEKSRDIYENLLKDDVEEVEVDEATDEEVDETTDEEVDEANDEEVDESDEDLDESTDEDLDESTDEEVDEATDEEVEENFVDQITPEADDDMGGDAADDMMADIAADTDGEEGEESDDEDIEDRVTDLEDTFDDLKAEFDAMMSDDKEGDDEGEDDMEMPMDAGDEGDEEEAEEAFAPQADLEVAPVRYEGAKDANSQMREYVEKVTANMGDNGDNTKSPVAGKNDMGGTTANIAKGSSEEKGGKASGPKEDNAGNVNVPGGKASKSMSANSKGHGAEKKGAGESGTDSKSVVGK
jgi:hypothetical protein